MSKLKSTRIQSIDFLRGVVMVIMALDHVRDYFHHQAFIADPTNMETTTPELFFTRFITHFCAPVFVFLAGTSAFLYSRNKTKKHLFTFLMTRGIWLVFVELVIMTWLWWFDVTFSFFNLQVIWAIGLCMISLAFIIYLPRKFMLALGLLLVFGHNLLDGITVEGNAITSLLWYTLHQATFVEVGGRMISFLYPIIPWIGVMTLGYGFGNLYHREFDANRRKKWLLRMGFGAILLFILLRAFNLYGDMAPWATQRNGIYTFLSFMNVTKYPPSLLFIFITLGPSMLFLYVTEKFQNRISDFFIVFGRVPFFYYVIHVFVIHIAAMIGLELTGESWSRMIITKDVLWQGQLAGYGYSLFTTYLVWFGIVALLYFPCVKYMRYKLKNKHKAWLSYL